ncbi:MAG TPA: hypothetical protein ENI64_07840 [Gammaproteobacteria bacterium]|nr:hypothetical protein [Gammaproteobacteria bacterium]
MLTEQEKQALKQTIRSNRHEVFLVSIEEMDAIVRSISVKNKTQIQQTWQKIKSKLEFGANYYSSGGDIATLTKLVGDLGGIGAKVYVKTYRGMPHIILKGYPGLRRVLTGTRYGISNPKVITMGLGKAGAINAAKVGGILTIVLLTTYRVVDFFLTDQVTLNRLVGTLATDIVKVGITTGLSIAVATGLGATTIAIGPILAVVFIGLLGTAGLTFLDETYGITDRIVAGLDELEGSAKSHVEGMKKGIQDAANDATDSLIDYAVESAQRIFVKLVNRSIRKFLSSTPVIN